MTLVECAKQIAEFYKELVARGAPEPVALELTAQLQWQLLVDNGFIREADCPEPGEEWKR